LEKLGKTWKNLEKPGKTWENLGKPGKTASQIIQIYLGWPMSETNSAHLRYISTFNGFNMIKNQPNLVTVSYFLGQTDLALSSGQHSRLTSQASSKGDQPALERRRGCAPAPELPRSKLWSAWLEAK
jgi:hypothetical protein